MFVGYEAHDENPFFHVGGFATQYDGVFAVPAIGEKGYLDVRVEVSSPGGHSSIPPEHTVRYSHTLRYPNRQSDDYIEHRNPFITSGRIRV